MCLAGFVTCSLVTCSVVLINEGPTMNFLHVAVHVFVIIEFGFATFEEACPGLFFVGIFPAGSRMFVGIGLCIKFLATVLTLERCA